LVDVVIEIVDARIPQSSRNPLIDELVVNKPRVIILNKEDLSDEKMTQEWLLYFNKLNQFKAIKFNATSLKGSILSALKEAVLALTAEKREKRAQKGILSHTVRSMVVGIPNVGKSTFINNIVGKKAAKTGNKPGVTRGKQWIRLDRDIELLDTPGILWPKFDDPEVGFRLAVTGAVNDFYGALLTEKQRLIFDFYYQDDLSLGEIAEKQDISRQAVYDIIKRSENILEEYENKLQLVNKFQSNNEKLQHALLIINELLSDNNNSNLFELKKIINDVINENE